MAEVRIITKTTCPPWRNLPNGRKIAALWSCFSTNIIVLTINQVGRVSSLNLRLVERWQTPRLDCFWINEVNTQPGQINPVRSIDVEQWMDTANHRDVHWMSMLSLNRKLSSYLRKVVNNPMQKQSICLRRSGIFLRIFRNLSNCMNNHEGRRQIISGRDWVV